MGRRWLQRQRSPWITLLQVIVVLVGLVAVGLMAVGRIPTPDAAEGLAILAIFLLGLPILVLTWLMFEVNRPNGGRSVTSSQVLPFPGRRAWLALALWPFYPLVLTPVTLAALGLWGPIIASAAIGLAVAALSSLFLFLLTGKDGDTTGFDVRAHPAGLADIRRQRERIEGLALRLGGRGIVTVLAVALIFGPFAGVLAMRVVGYRGLVAYALTMTGAVLNASVWTGGVYNILWWLARSLWHGLLAG